MRSWPVVLQPGVPGAATGWEGALALLTVLAGALALLTVLAGALALLTYVTTAALIRIS